MLAYWKVNAGGNDDPSTKRTLTSFADKGGYKSSRLCRTFACTNFEGDDIVAFAINDVIPHGNGINGMWNVIQSKEEPRNWVAKNTYSAMDEAGGYCHDYDFSVEITAQWLPTKDGAIVGMLFSDVVIDGDVEDCCGIGLHQYLDDWFGGLNGETTEVRW